MIYEHIIIATNINGIAIILSSVRLWSSFSVALYFHIQSYFSYYQKHDVVCVYTSISQTSCFLIKNSVAYVFVNYIAVFIAFNLDALTFVSTQFNRILYNITSNSHHKRRLWFCPSNKVFINKIESQYRRQSYIKNNLEFFELGTCDI